MAGRDHDRLVPALSKLASELTTMIANTKASYHRSRLDSFLNRDSREHGLLSLYPVGAYYSCFLSAGVKTRKELEELWSSLYTTESVRDAVDELLSAEESYREYISEIDNDLQQGLEDSLSPFETSTLGSQLPVKMTLVDASSGTSIGLESLLQRSQLTLFVFRKLYL